MGPICAKRPELEGNGRKWKELEDELDGDEECDWRVALPKKCGEHLEKQVLNEKKELRRYVSEGDHKQMSIGYRMKRRFLLLLTENIVFELRSHIDSSKAMVSHDYGHRLGAQRLYPQVPN